jgi:hypothetical protein
MSVILPSVRGIRNEGREKRRDAIRWTFNGRVGLFLSRRRKHALRRYNCISYMKFMYLCLGRKMWKKIVVLLIYVRIQTRKCRDNERCVSWKWGYTHGAGNCSSAAQMKKTTTEMKHDTLPLSKENLHIQPSQKNIRLATRVDLCVLNSPSFSRPCTERKIRPMSGLRLNGRLHVATFPYPHFNPKYIVTYRQIAR